MRISSRRQIVLWGLAAVAACLLLATAALTGEAPRDFAFLFSSDPHIGSDDPKAMPPVTVDQVAAKAISNTANALKLIGEPFPARLLSGLPAGRIPAPRGFLIAGDLTDRGAWAKFEEVFPAAMEPGGIPVFVAAGNHDGDPSGPARRGILARNRQHAAAKRLEAISPNGFHYAWQWNGVHFICVNLCPADTTDPETPFTYGKPGPGSWNDPLAALKFLKEYLRNVGRDDPVIIWQHYGYCEGFNFDWYWWSAKQRRAFYDAVKDYNIVALLHGHTHAAEHYLWPDPKADKAEVERLFGSEPPPNMRSFDVFSAGAIGDGAFYLFRITDDRLFALHLDPKGWSRDPRLTLSKKLAPERTP